MKPFFLIMSKMQISKRLTMAIIVGLGIGTVHALTENVDTPDQAKLKAEQEAKIKAEVEALKAKANAGIASLGVVPPSDQAQANDARLVEALRKKQAELAAASTKKSAPVADLINEPAGQSNELVAAVRKKQAELAAKDAETAKVAGTKQAPVIVPVSAVQNLDKASQAINAPSSEEKMNEMVAAVRKKQAELAAKDAEVAKAASNAPKATLAGLTVVAPDKASEDKTAEAVAAVRKKQAELAKEEAAKVAAQDAQKKKEQEILAKAIADENAKKAAKVEVKKVEAKKVAAQPELIKTQKETPAAKSVVAKKITKTAEVPVLTKEQKLADLLRRYKADQITPREYHSERAKLISEP